ncbi:putative lmbr1 domain-containing protein [Eutypa lata UCREL1]|uniref:Putative lmbr1 domain-containing protein n=1 Tax=Eutypa lata (strain UCR-EL1) TaxID=1287681 RepID=M7TVF1_EUTLA|nr:putative lmbr1 domain-containing protein [Eutypa lata UCREL1]
MTEPPAKKEKDHHHHRLSFPGLHLGGSKAPKEQPQHPHASLDWRIESPPAMMHGDPDNSTGALVSGQMVLKAKDIPLEVESFTARLNIHVTQKKPFQGHCSDCANQKTELKSWTFLAEPTTLTPRTHEFPFSVLLEGHLPATTDNSLVSIQYDFFAEVKPTTGPTLKLSKTIDVKRSLPVSDLPHHSIRVFPPTNIAASVHYPQVIHPIGGNKMELRLDGIVKHNVDVKSVEYWKLKRLSWRIEESLSTVAPACEKHTPKPTEPDQAPKKGLKRSADRVIGSADLHSGWKADYGPDGKIEAEIEFHCDPNMKPACNLKSADGTEITHQLVVEMVVVQEYAPTSNLKHITPTGVARILRMHFGVVLTERPGLGVSWDNEAPPIYQDVPPSPPRYIPPSPPTYTSTELQFEGMEELMLSARSSVENPTSASSSIRGGSSAANSTRLSLHDISEGDPVD